MSEHQRCPGGLSAAGRFPGSVIKSMYTCVSVSNYHCMYVHVYINYKHWNLNTFLEKQMYTCMYCMYQTIIVCMYIYITYIVISTEILIHS